MEELIEKAPQKCGVYIFKGKRKPVYIGKAKNLKKRLQQHLKLAQKDPKEAMIINSAVGLEWIITRNEYEALVLEIDLIQSYKPRFNVLHKYGSGYPMLLITQDSYPTVKVVRGTQHEGLLYGPFLQAKKANQVRRLIHKLFRLRTCDPMPVRKEPCMDYHLGLCCAPCCGYATKKEYNLNLESAKALLSGKVGEVLPELYSRLEEFSRELMFEKCAVIRDQIKALENISKGQGVSALPFEEADFIYRLGLRVGMFLIRGRKLISKRVYDFEKEEEVEEFVLGYYYSNYVPSLIITNFTLSDEVKRWISSKAKTSPRFVEEAPKELLELADENLKDSVNLEALEREFLQKLGMDMPKVIEGFDISHFYGEDTVGSCVVWEGGKMNKKRYRRYKIKSLNGIDDYGALREVLTRRAKRLKAKTEPMPDAWLIDGGVGQLNVALEVRERFRLSFRVFSLAKEEEILFTDKGDALPLKENHLLYRVFGEIRDEAHRFALTFNRKLREKRALEDVLSKVKGVGEARKRIIYRNFESLYEFIEAEDEELKRLGLPTSLKQEVKRYIL